MINTVRGANSLSSVKGSVFSHLGPSEILAAKITTLLGLYAIHATVTLTRWVSLQFDGSYYVMAVAINKGFNNLYLVSRLGARVAQEAPAVLAVHAFDLNLRQVYWIYSITALLIPLLGMIITYLVLPKPKKYLWSFCLIGNTFLFVNAYYFQVWEMWVCHSIIWVLVALIVRHEHEWSLVGLSSALALLAVGAFTYPSLMLASFLFLLALRKNRAAKQIVFVSALVLCILIEIYFVKTFPLKTSWRLFWNVFRYHHTDWFARINFALMILILSVIFLKARRLFWPAALAAMVLIVFAGQKAKGWEFYDARTFGAFLSIAVVAWCLLEHRWPKRFADGPQLKLAAAVSAVIALTSSLVFSARLREYQMRFLERSSSLRGVISYEAYRALDPQFAEECNGWTAAEQSVWFQYLAGRPVSVIVDQLRNPDQGQAFTMSLGVDEYVERLKPLGVEFAPDWKK